MTTRGRKTSDHLLILAVVALLIFGVIMITSIGVPKSIKLSAPDLLYPNCSNDAVDCYLLLKKHLVRLLFGIVAFLAFLKINYRWWEKISLPFFVLTVGLLIAVLIFGSSNNTFAKSWFNIYDSSLQPAEFAKLALILYLAKWMEKRNKDVRTFQYGFLPFCIISILVILPIIFQPDLGSTIVITIICVAIYFVAGARIRDIALGGIIAVLISSIVISNVSYLKQRVKAYISPTENCVESYCWQSQQADIAIGSGGIFGTGLTQGIQKSYWLPQASDDFIFAASAEELGFLRIIFVVLAYVIIGYRGFQIANHAPNRFAAYTAVGITTWIVFQAFVNIAVNTSLLPITGITLPFVSYGGSSLVACLMGIGILSNISKQTTAYAHSSNRRRNGGARYPKYRYH